MVRFGLNDFLLELDSIRLNFLTELDYIKTNQNKCGIRELLYK